MSKTVEDKTESKEVGSSSNFEKKNHSNVFSKFLSSSKIFSKEAQKIPSKSSLEDNDRSKSRKSNLTNKSLTKKSVKKPPKNVFLNQFSIRKTLENRYVDFEGSSMNNLEEYGKLTTSNKPQRLSQQNLSKTIDHNANPFFQTEDINSQSAFKPVGEVKKKIPHRRTTSSGASKKKNFIQLNKIQAGMCLQAYARNILASSSSKFTELNKTEKSKDKSRERYVDFYKETIHSF